jgi:hypothetical protein
VPSGLQVRNLSHICPIWRPAWSRNSSKLIADESDSIWMSAYIAVGILQTVNDTSVAILQGMDIFLHVKSSFYSVMGWLCHRRWHEAICHNVPRRRPQYSLHTLAERPLLGRIRCARYATAHQVSKPQTLNCISLVPPAPGSTHPFMLILRPYCLSPAMQILLSCFSAKDCFESSKRSLCLGCAELMQSSSKWKILKWPPHMEVWGGWV